MDLKLIKIRPELSVTHSDDTRLSQNHLNENLPFTRNLMSVDKWETKFYCTLLICILFLLLQILRYSSATRLSVNHDEKSFSDYVTRGLVLSGYSFISSYLHGLVFDRRACQQTTFNAWTVCLPSKLFLRSALLQRFVLGTRNHNDIYVLPNLLRSWPPRAYVVQVIFLPFLRSSSKNVRHVVFNRI